MERTPVERHDLLVQAIERDMGVKVELDALGKRAIGVFDAILQGRHKYGRDAIGYYVVSGTSGADDVLAPLLIARWAEAFDRATGEVAVDNRTAVRVRRVARTLRRHHAHAARRSALPAASRCARSHAVRSDRLFRHQQGERHLRRAFRHVPRAGRSFRGARLPPTKRHVIFHARGGSIRAWRLAHRFARAHGARGHHQRCTAAHRTGRGHQPELRAQGPSRCARSNARSTRSEQPRRQHAGHVTGGPSR
jgi:hypothetical protein